MANEKIVIFHHDERGAVVHWSEMGELVRCKDCVYSSIDGSHLVCIHCGEVDHYAYCSRGRLKDKAQQQADKTDTDLIQKYLSSALFDEQGIGRTPGLSQKEKDVIYACINYYDKNILKGNVFQFLNRQKDFQSIVLCENCKLWDVKKKTCPHSKHRNPYRGYCSWGERKDDADNR